MPTTPPPQQQPSSIAPPTSPNTISSPLPKRQKTTSTTSPSTADDSLHASTSTSKSTKTMADEATATPLPTPSTTPALLIHLLSPTATPPTRGSPFAAGYDLYASQAITIPKQGKALVETDLSMAVPEGTYGRIAPRSGLASKNHIATGAGVIDADYRGPVKVLLFNHSPTTDFSVAVGDRIAQLVLERIITPEVVVVDTLQGLGESVRGGGGFGSTGVGKTG